MAQQASSTSGTHFWPDDDPALLRRWRLLTRPTCTAPIMAVGLWPSAGLKTRVGDGKCDMANIVDQQ